LAENLSQSVAEPKLPRENADGDDLALAGCGLRKGYGRGRGRTEVLRGLDIEVRRGEFLAVMGPSGCGKSTLLHVLGLMTPADEGEVRYGREAVGLSEACRRRLRRREIGFVFQRFNLLGELTARQNLRISLKVRGLRDESRIDELFERMGVAHVADRRPGEMSIGEQQRIAVARGIAHRPRVLLADEPTGNLDSANEASLLDLLRGTHRHEGHTIVLITHSRAAAEAADRIVHMRDGRLAEEGE
jgi:ABC-type lipoprotein export system ATPase subunit